jgi:uncharacterized protein YukE
VSHIDVKTATGNGDHMSDSDESRMSHAAVAELGRSFERQAYDLERYAGVFERAAGVDVGGEAAAAYEALAEQVQDAFGELHRRLDTIGAALVATARNSEASDDALARAFGTVGTDPAS